MSDINDDKNNNDDEDKKDVGLDAKYLGWGPNPRDRGTASLGHGCLDLRAANLTLPKDCHTIKSNLFFWTQNEW